MEQVHLLNEAVMKKSDTAGLRLGRAGLQVHLLKEAVMTKTKELENRRRILHDERANLAKELHLEKCAKKMATKAAGRNHLACILYIGLNKIQ